MAETFTEEEQEEIINSFLNEKEDFKTVHERLNMEAGNHFRTTRKIETKTYVPIKYALMKYYNKSEYQKDIGHYEWRRNKMSKKYDYILQVHKKETDMFVVKKDWSK